MSDVHHHKNSLKCSVQPATMYLFLQLMKGWEMFQCSVSIDAMDGDSAGPKVRRNAPGRQWPGEIERKISSTVAVDARRRAARRERRPKRGGPALRIQHPEDIKWCSARENP